MANNDLPRVVIYTDGACDPNPGPGGWAALLKFRGRQKTLTGGEPETTNNRMELTAAVMALQALKEPCQVDLYTDSEYLQRGITEWLAGWKQARLAAQRRPPGQRRPVAGAGRGNAGTPG